MISAFSLSLLLFVGLFLLSWKLGQYLSFVFQESEKRHMEGVPFTPLDGWVDRIFLRFSTFNMSYKEYVASLFSFHFVVLFALYLLLRGQQPLLSWLCSEQAEVIAPSAAMNIAISFVTNTDWQAIDPQQILHPICRSILLLPAMFLSPAVGLSVFFALLRGLSAEKGYIGNFFKDMSTVLFYILLPLSLLTTLLLCFFGTEQTTIQAPLAFFEAIKTLGTNGGGFFADNSAHIRENPTTWTTMLQWGYMLLLPMGALRILSEKMGNKKYGFRVGVLFCCILACVTAFMEYQESSTHSLWILDQSEGALQGKEVRVGSFFTSLWTVTTTATSCGATICDITLLKPLSKIIPLSLMHAGETFFGGAGTGALSLLFMQVVAMFSAGLLVGRTPDLFGKKIDSGAMKLALLAVMLPVFLIYIALWFQISFGLSELPLTPEKAMTPLVYSMTSTAVNNGSGLSGMDYSLPCLSSVHSFLMLAGRLLFLLFALLLGEHLRQGKVHPRTEGSIHIESWTSILWLGFVTVSSSLLFFCALWIVGPVMELYTRGGG